jgi:hypothetical protein
LQKIVITTSSLVRKLIAIDMICQDLAEYRQGISPSGQARIDQDYVRLLSQFHDLMATLKENAKQYTEVGFVELVAQSGLSIQFKNKKILSIYLKLSEYVIDYYQVSGKAREIRDTEFSDHAEKRLALLLTKAIKARSQFKTVVQALGKIDYQQFAHFTALPMEDWSWEILRLEKD